MRRALLCWLCAVTLPAPAAEVILVADSARNGRVVQQLRTEAVNGVRPAPGYPRVMKSEEIPGLKPGRMVTVLGICEDRQAAQRAVTALKGKLPLSIRAAEGEWPGACPSTDPPPPADPYEAKLVRRIEDQPDSDDALFQYAQYLQMAGRLDEAEEVLDKLLKRSPDHRDARDLKAVVRVLQGI
ncbi:MAG TPA: tetratricopeptide repeat protein [Myxococcales bacterium]|nr:tetratricopeptide repeat protein [Myxococcales bacterium]